MKLSRIFLLLSLVSALSAACAPFGSPKPPTAQPQALPISVPQSPAPTPVSTSAGSPISRPEAPTPAGEVLLSPEAANLVAKAKEILTQKMPEVNAAGITLSTAESRQWRDSSLGCPREGMMYNQVITPGYLIVLEAEGKTYEFHTNKAEKVILCLIDGQKPN